MKRQCGDCQLCCKLLPMQEFDKPAGERCKHQRHVGQMRPLLMTHAARAEIARAVAEARKTPLPLDLIMEIAKGTPQEKATLMLADRKPDFVCPESQHVLIDVGYHAAISFQEQPAGLVRHLSISVDGKPGALPNVPAVMALAAEFGLPGGLEDWKVWTEEYEPGQFAVNIVALDPDQYAEAGHTMAVKKARAAIGQKVGEI